MAHRSQCSSLGDNPLDPNYLPPHYREDYRLAIDALVEDDVQGYNEFLQRAGTVDFLSRPEVEHIRNTVQAPRHISQPELLYTENEADGSSDTYWPVHSDLEAPVLDLGWPVRHSFIGPTEVTTLVNPSDPEMPSIKEQARRLIKRAQQVVAVVMDMFTDVDIFSDLLDAAARHIPVYILLDEQNAHHFCTMVTSCRVNLEMVPMMRIRTVSGITYFCRTGKSFKGQMMDRFLLTDCQAVLSGNYSFMWSFEKIHRCIAHLFLGELVTTFDEEFRILFAQSQPLVLENALVPLPRDSSTYGGSQFSFKRSQSFRNPRGVPYLNMESSRHAELSGYPFGERMDIDRSTLPFRRDDHLRHTSTELGPVQMSSNKFLRMERSFFDQGRSIMASRQMEMNAYKRHSYAEGTHESFTSARQFMKHRVMNNLEEMESHFQSEQHHYQGGGPGSGFGHYNKMRSQGYHQSDQYLESECPPEFEAAGSYSHMVDHLSPDTSKAAMHEHRNLVASGGGRYTQTKPTRPSMGHSYACQSSPTQPHPPDLKHLFPGGDVDRLPQDPSAKQGLRNWRITSYLSAYENTEQEGLPQPLGPDAFEDYPQPSEGKLHGSESSVPRFGAREFPNIPSERADLLPRYGKPVLTRPQAVPEPGDQASAGMDYMHTSGMSGTKKGDKLEEVQKREPREISITKHESFRSRLNPMLQRSSRLRSSLIFSSSKLEQHSSLALRSGSGADANEEDETNSLKTSSIVAQILEKRRSMSREPFELSNCKKTDAKDTAPVDTSQPDVSTKEAESGALVNDPPAKEQGKAQPSDSCPQTQHSTAPSTNMNDPESRLLYFKELAAKRKASRLAVESTTRSPEPKPKKPDLSAIPPDTSTQKPVNTVTLTELNSVKAPAEVESDTPMVSVKPSEMNEGEPPSSKQREVKNGDKSQRKESLPPKTPIPLPSPKFLKKDSLKPFKSSHFRRISCDEDMLTDATDAEKSEMKKSRCRSSSSSVSQGELGEKLQKNLGSSTSLNVLDGGGEGKQDKKPLDFLKKQTQRLKGLLSTKGDKKAAAAEEKAAQSMRTVPEDSEESNSKLTASPSPGRTSNADNNAVTAESKGEKSSKPATKPSQSRYQSSTTNILYSSNLRDDTKVILEQISANSQKNRTDVAKQSPGSAAEAKEVEGDKRTRTETEPSITYYSRNRFQHSQSNSHERDSLLKRIESFRKEKKVYSRFEVFCSKRD
ncbi:protein FAM83H isoform X1 [Scleropages formosus]|uniref:protein FAM83H isoform X1 n=1 Tax=Scleropages formosus TaxID=113540 RepID=UPI0010FA9C93|nr:protein FAM83H isoform X1 [Scleropages formosus]XP_018603391.2 protein FAM83H isoform X1 [Scleropages formosus]